MGGGDLDPVSQIFVAIGIALIMPIALLASLLLCEWIADNWWRITLSHKFPYNCVFAALEFKAGGISLFALVIAVNVCALLLDLLLTNLGMRSISSYVWEHPLLGIPIIAWQFLGVFGLALHFYCRN